MLVNKKYEANHFLTMFPDRGQNFSGLKHSTEIMTWVASLIRAWVMADHTLPTKFQYVSLVSDQCL